MTSRLSQPVLVRHGFGPHADRARGDGEEGFPHGLRRIPLTEYMSSGTHPKICYFAGIEMTDFYEIDFLPVHKSDSGDAITIRY